MIPIPIPANAIGESIVDFAVISSGAEGGGIYCVVIGGRIPASISFAVLI